MKLLLESDRDVMRYLSRIGLNEVVSVDLNGLNTLIHAQLTHVPFEALDVWGAGKCPSLEIPDLFHKIVVDHRGGYCFELNTIFRALLNSLGFEAYQVIASLVDESGEAAPPAHNGIVCLLDGEKYFIDVGFGGPVPFFAMELREGWQNGFRLERKNGFWYMFRDTGNGEANMIRFRDIPAEPCELVPLNFYVSQKPDIHFRHVLRVSLRNAENTVCTLVDHELTIHSSAQTKVLQIIGLDDLRLTLRKYFGIDLDKVSVTKEY